MVRGRSATIRGCRDARIDRMTPPHRYLLALAALTLGAGACSQPMGQSGSPSTTGANPPSSASTMAATSTTSTTMAPTTTQSPPTTSSPWGGSEGTLPVPGGGDITVFFANKTNPNKDVPPLQPGQRYISVGIRVCAKGQNISVEPAKWTVEVPGQGTVPAQPLKLKSNSVVAGQVVKDKECFGGSVPFVIAGEGNVTAVFYATPAGPMRWATSTL